MQENFHAQRRRISPNLQKRCFVSKDSSILYLYKMLRVLILSCLLITDVTQVHALSQALITYLSNRVNVGNSLIHRSVTSMLNDGYMITCVIVVENWTKYPLELPIARESWGVVSSKPVRILPGSKEAMVARKTGYTSTGTSGTVSWLISGTKRRLVVTWSVPFSYAYYKNTLAVGITFDGTTTHPSGSTWFDLMYYQYIIKDMSYSWRQFTSDMNSSYYTNAGFEVLATMTSGHEAVVNVVFRPIDEKDLAPY